MKHRPIIGIAPNLEDGRGKRAGNDASPFSFVKHTYLTAIMDAGGTPITLPSTTDPEIIDQLEQMIDGLLILGSDLDISGTHYGSKPGPMQVRYNEAKTRYEIELLVRARATDVPIFGICNGLQALNVASGGTLWQDLPSERGIDGHNPPDSTVTAHRMRPNPGTRLASIVGPGVLDVNSSHHQAIRELGAQLTISGAADDGVIEAIEDPSRPFVLGVQWHPELLLDRPESRRIFEAFVQAAAARRNR